VRWVTKGEIMGKSTELSKPPVRWVTEKLADELVKSVSKPPTRWVTYTKRGQKY